LRSLNEADIFKENFQKFCLIAIHSSPDTRFQRLARRGRSDDTSNWQIFNDRDMRELGVGLGNVIAMAEQMVINDRSAEQAEVKIKEALGRIEKKWNK